MKEVALAKDDGRWVRAYDSSATASVPGDFLKALAKQKKAKAFFARIQYRRTSLRRAYFCEVESVLERFYSARRG